MAAEGHSSGVDAPALTIVVVADGDDGLAETVDALAGEQGVDVVVARPWPEAPGAGVLALPAGVRTVWAAGEGAASAANAAIASARAPAALLLAAGDVPAAGIVRAHVALLDAGADAVVGRLRGDAVRDAWVGPAPPWTGDLSRHASVRVAAAARCDGLDDRLHSLDVAVPDLLARLAGDGATLERDPRLVVTAPPPTPTALRAVGRSAQAVAVRDAAGGVPPRVGPRRAGVTLRWAGALLRAAARLAGDRDERLKRLAMRAAFAEGRGLPPLALGRLDRIGLAPPPGAERPAVSIVVPFAGDQVQAAELLDALDAVTRRDGDEIVVVDNSRSPVVEPRPGIAVVRAEREWSSYHGRNVGWRAATAPWLLFVDADCRPVPAILDAYFSPPPAQGTGAVVGAVLAPHERAGFVERYSADAGVLSQSRSLEHPYRPYGVTANLLVRREALERLGGFCEGVRSGADAELSWRLQEDGWALEHRWRAAVEHRHRSSLRGLLRQYGRYGAGVAWHERHRPGASSGWLRPRIRPWRMAAIDLAGGRFRLAATGLTSIACQLAAFAGSARSNRPARGAAPATGGTTAFAATWPGRARDDASPGGAEVVEARERPLHLATAGAVEAWYREDDATSDRLAGLAWAIGSARGAALVAGRALRGRRELEALASDAAVARRVEARAARELTHLDASGERDARAVSELLADRERSAPAPSPG